MASSQNFFSRLAGKARHGSPNSVGKDSGPVMEAPSATARQGSPRAIFQKWLSGGMTSTPSTGSPLLPVLPVLPVAPQGASWSRKRFPRCQQALDGKACKGGGIPLSRVVPLTWDGGNECDAHLYRGRAVCHVSCNLCKRLCNVTVKFCSLEQARHCHLTGCKTRESWTMTGSILTCSVGMVLPSLLIAAGDCKNFRDRED